MKFPFEYGLRLIGIYIFERETEMPHLMRHDIWAGGWEKPGRCGAASARSGGAGWFGKLTNLAVCFGLAKQKAGGCFPPQKIVLCLLRIIMYIRHAQ